MITRRTLLACGATSLCLPYPTFAKEFMQLRAEPVELALLSPNKQTSLWGFNGSTPGPTIRARQGERVKIRFKNALTQSSAIHWHGIRIDNKMDGVPELTQPHVMPNDDFLYDFVVPDAGTYWYHSHDRSWEQVARGLYGALIVEEQNPPLVDHDIIVFVDDWRLDINAVQIDDFENRHDQAHEGRLGNFAKAIFQNIKYPIRLNERIRLRFINVATDRIFPLHLSGLSGKFVAYDGMPIVSPQPIENFVLAPAQRVDIIADIIEEKIKIDFYTDDDWFRLGNLEVQGRNEQINKSEIMLPMSNYNKIPDLKNAIELEMEIQGGAMSFHMMRGDIWSFSGVSGMTDKPFYKFKRGQTAIINLANDTRFPHAIHLHGHHMQIINSNGLSPLHDTVLVETGETIKIICVFDNKGKWLFHCHMLAHQATGMKTWFEVI